MGHFKELFVKFFKIDTSEKKRCKVFSSLTPNHFLIGSANCELGFVPVNPSAEEGNGKYLECYQIIFGTDGLEFDNKLALTIE